MKFINRIKKDNGQAMVEFALVLPILLLLIGGIIDFGWIFYNQFMTNNATREATRFIAIHYNLGDLDDTPENVALEMILNSVETIKESDANVYKTIETDGEGGQKITINFEGDIIVLTPILSSILGNEYTVKSECTMRVEENS